MATCDSVCDPIPIVEEIRGGLGEALETFNFHFLFIDDGQLSFRSGSLTTESSEMLTSKAGLCLAIREFAQQALIKSDGLLTIASIATNFGEAEERSSCQRPLRIEIMENLRVGLSGGGRLTLDLFNVESITKLFTEGRLSSEERKGEKKEYQAFHDRDESTAALMVCHETVMSAMLGRFLSVRATENCENSERSKIEGHFLKISEILPDFVILKSPSFPHISAN